MSNRSAIKRSRRFAIGLTTSARSAIAPGWATVRGARSMTAAAGEEAERRTLAVAASTARLIRVGEQFHNRLAAQLGIGATDLAALGYLDSSGPLTPRQLAILMDLTPGTVTALL